MSGNSSALPRTRDRAEPGAGGANGTRPLRHELEEMRRPWHTSDIAQIRDDRGSVVVLPDGMPAPYGFDVNRVYFLHTESPGAVRGNHAHKRLRQVIICLSGCVTVELDDGLTTENFCLDSPTVALMIGPRVWRRLHRFAAGTICAVLASEAYDPEDYLHTYDEFLTHVASWHDPAA